MAILMRNVFYAMYITCVSTSPTLITAVELVKMTADQWYGKIVEKHVAFV